MPFELSWFGMGKNHASTSPGSINNGTAFQPEKLINLVQMMLRRTYDNFDFPFYIVLFYGLLQVQDEWEGVLDSFRDTPCIYLFLPLPSTLSLFLYLSLCLPIRLSIYLPVFLSIYPSFYLSTRLSISVFIIIYPSFNLPIRLSRYLYMYSIYI